MTTSHSPNNALNDIPHALREEKAQLRLDRRGPPHPPSPSHHPSRCEGDAKAKAEGAHQICRDTVPHQHDSTRCAPATRIRGRAPKSRPPACQRSQRRTRIAQDARERHPPMFHTPRKRARGVPQ